MQPIRSQEVGTIGGRFPSFLLTPRFFFSATLKSNKQHLQLHVHGDKSRCEPVGLMLKPKIRLI